VYVNLYQFAIHDFRSVLYQFSLFRPLLVGFDFTLPVQTQRLSGGMTFHRAQMYLFYRSRIFGLNF
jgi:hypothetical protein